LRSADGDPSARLIPGASLAIAALARAALAGVVADAVTAFRGSFGSEEAGAPRFAAERVAFAVVIERLG
jgi:hypothetical protein